MRRAQPADDSAQVLRCHSQSEPSTDAQSNQRTLAGPDAGTNTRTNSGPEPSAHTTAHGTAHTAAQRKPYTNANQCTIAKSNDDTDTRTQPIAHAGADAASVR